MNKITPQTYQKWQTDVLSHLRTANYDPNVFTPIFDFAAELKNTKSLREPFSEKTNDFLNSFIPSVISIILKTSSPSASIDSNYSKILKAFSSLVPIFIASDNDSFIEAASLIATSQKAAFYMQSFSDFFGATSSFSPHYQSCIKLIVAPPFFQQIDAYFDFPSISIHRSYIIFILLSAAYKSLDARALKDFLKKVLKKFQYEINRTEDKELRNINEKELNRIYKNFLMICSDSKVSAKMIEMNLNFNIKCIKSGLLSKQYNGLKLLRELLISNNKNIHKLVFSSLEHANVIDYLLQNTHHELVKDFVIIMREMIKADMIKPSQIKQFWVMSVHQHQSTIDIFFSALSNLSVTLTQAQKSALFEAIIDTNEFPDSSLIFLGKNILKLDQKQISRLFKAISELYFSKKRKESNALILSTLSKLIPSSKESRMKIQEKCLRFIETQENLEYSLAILKEILIDLNEESAFSYFYSIINLSSIENPQYLDLILRIWQNINGCMIDQDFRKLDNLTEQLYYKHPFKVIEFWKEMITKKRINNDMILTILRNSSKPNYISNDIFSFIQFLFVKMNSKRITYDIGENIAAVKKVHKCFGLKELWDLLYRVGSQSIADFIIQLYQKSKQRDKYLNFLEYCTPKIDTAGVLNALSSLIHEVEDGIYKELLNIYPNNFLSDEDFNKVTITGEAEICMRIPKFCNANALLTQISYLLDKSRQCLIFTVNDQVFTKNDKIENNMVLKVETNRTIVTRPPPPLNPSSLPSMAIFNSPIRKQLYKIMTKNDPHLSMLAYTVLSLLPTIDDEIKLIKKSNVDWKSFFQTEKTFLFLYRSDIIGNIIASHDSEWFDRFLSNDGALIFISTVLDLSNNISIPSLTKLMKICCLITKQSHWDLFACSIFNSISDDSMTTILNILIGSDDPDLTSTCLYFLSKVASCNVDALIISKELGTLVKRTIFHKDVKIRESIRNIVLMLPLEKQIEFSTPLLSKSETTSKCTEFFTLLKEIAKTTDDCKGLWNKLVNIFIDGFAIPKTDNPIIKLEFETPYPQFVNGLITTLIELTKRLDSLTNTDGLFWFIIDNILLNCYKYYELNQEYFELLSILIQKQPSLSSELVQKLNQIDFPSSKTIINCKLSPYKREKGLKNLGATCYMNSTLQQLYHISEFRNLILSSHINSPTQDDHWFFELQDMFAKLLYFPSSYIDPTGYVKLWKGWDDTYVNPRQQQDAVEYLQMLLDRIEEKVPNSSNLFKGEIVHSVVGISQEYTAETVETFVIFPLEVKDHQCINDSLTTFLAPNRFDGNNQYIVDGLGKIDAERFSRVRIAPKILILQLKRFEYNLLTSVREKVNDLYKFANELDMSPVMENPCENVVYQLCGVTIHMGSAQGGHYISHILTDFGWLTFNDDNVSAVTEAKIEATSFGGYDFVESWDDKNQKTTVLKVPKNGNAYLLFYRRVMMSARDESSVFDFNLIAHESRSINPIVLVNFLRDMKGVLLKNVLMSPNFNKFLMSSIEFKDNQHTFLYNYMIVCMRNHSDQNLLIQITNMIKNKQISRELAEFVISKKDDLLEFLLLESSRHIHRLYYSVLEKLIPELTEESKTELMKFLLDKMLNEESMLMEYWRNFDEFFKPFLLLLDKNNENLVPVFFNFLLTTVIEYAEKHKEKSKVLTKINLSSIFEVLNHIIKEHNLYSNFKAQAMDSNFILSFVQSKYHSQPFINFAVSFNVKPETLFKKFSEKINATAAASFFVIALTFGSNTDFVTNFVKSKNNKFIEDYFKALTDRILSFELSKKNLFVPMRSLLDHLVISREKSLRISILEFFEAAQVNREDLFNFLISEIYNVIHIVDLVSYDVTRDEVTQGNTLNLLPTREYFALLKKTVVLGNFQDKVIKNGKCFTHAIKMFTRMVFYPNHPIMDTLEFLNEALGPENSEKFFKVAPFSVYLESMSLASSNCEFSYLKNFLNFIPNSYNDVFFKHSVYVQLIELIFRDKLCGPLLMEETIKRANNGNCALIAHALWSSDGYKKNSKHNGYSYFKTSWKILKLFPSQVSSVKSSIFDGCLEIVEKSVNGSTSIAPYVAKFLSVYCTAFVANNKGKKTLFKGDLVEYLGKKFQDLKLRPLLTLARHDSMFCDFLSSISKLSPKIHSKLFELVENDRDGFLKRVSNKAIKSASRLIVELCKLNKDQAKTKIVLMRELAYTVTSKAADPVCYELLNIKSFKFNAILPTIQKVIEETDDPKMFGSFCGKVIIEAVKSDHTTVNPIIERAALLLQVIIADHKVLDNKTNIRILAEFFIKVHELFSPQMPKISIDEVGTKELKSLELSSGKNTFVILSELNMIN
ncbi:hypothetical protein TRFO_01109 [Tritrichomonas foetus]|uniref:USP domain-containing protein n=1 Tax=Tritrichomonas foetus TaxID=1144522 RepID=A0A1J4KIK4_9EUKA|nr:hypothetical protein TRFO_01109 [Tritrichomonas foetus]|eukprot:OHT11183.1 hypothetical protein TRFO_01109 [Tritrichomonas foetus]